MIRREDRRTRIAEAAGSSPAWSSTMRVWRNGGRGWLRPNIYGGSNPLTRTKEWLRSRMQ
jgi:hypothetical protein